MAAVVGRSAGARSLLAELAGDTCHAPHLVDAELGSVLRRLTAAQALAPTTGHRLLHVGAALIAVRHPMIGRLASAAWELRQTITFYDAGYVALAAEMQVMLVTADARLARAASAHCGLRLVDPR